MRKSKQMNRRRFLKTSLAGVVGTSLVSYTEPNNNDSSGKNLKIREYRTLGRTGFKVSDIGIGTSFLTNEKVLEMALKMGLNYLDTAEHYSRGESERTIGKVITNANRNQIFISTKLNLSFGPPPTKKSIKERFMKCLHRMQTDYADCLMIHMCTLEQVKHHAFHEAANELKKEGKIKFIGLSSHGLEQQIYGSTKDPMEKVVVAAAEDGRFDVALFVYNFLQKEQGEKIIKACEKAKIGVTLMKTNPVNVYKRKKESIDRAVAAGRKTSEVMKQRMVDYRQYISRSERFYHKYGLKGENDIRDAAIKFVLNHPGVHTICASMNSFNELETFASLSGQKLLAKETSMLNIYKNNLGHYYCRHACGECEHACPNGVPVNSIMRFNHYYVTQGQEKYAMQKYAELSSAKADLCDTCSGFCQHACPYKVSIQGLLLDAHENLTLA